MRHLIDTQSLIWFVDRDELLSPAAHRAMADPVNDLLISAASIWEIAIKIGLGKLSLSLPFRQWMDRAIHDLELEILPITVAYADAVVSLPSHHRDPFDRLMAA